MLTIFRACYKANHLDLNLYKLNIIGLLRRKSFLTVFVKASARIINEKIKCFLTLSLWFFGRKEVHKVPNCLALSFTTAKVFFSKKQKNSLDVCNFGFGTNATGDAWRAKFWDGKWPGAAIHTSCRFHTNIGLLISLNWVNGCD